MRSIAEMVSEGWPASGPGRWLSDLHQPKPLIAHLHNQILSSWSHSTRVAFAYKARNTMQPTIDGNAKKRATPMNLWLKITERAKRVPEKKANPKNNLLLRM